MASFVLLLFVVCGCEHASSAPRVQERPSPTQNSVSEREPVSLSTVLDSALSAVGAEPPLTVRVSQVKEDHGGLQRLVAEFEPAAAASFRELVRKIESSAQPIRVTRYVIKRTRPKRSSDVLPDEWRLERLEVVEADSPGVGTAQTITALARLVDSLIDTASYDGGQIEASPLELDLSLPNGKTERKSQLLVRVANNSAALAIEKSFREAQQLRVHQSRSNQVRSGHYDVRLEFTVRKNAE